MLRLLTRLLLSRLFLTHSVQMIKGLLLTRQDQSPQPHPQAEPSLLELPDPILSGWEKESRR